MYERTNDVINLRDEARLKELGATYTAAANYPSAGSIYYNGYWGTLNRILDVQYAPCGCKTAKHRKACAGPRMVSVTEESITAVNGRLALLGKPEPARKHCTQWDARRDYVVDLAPDSSVHGN